jgi:hypothetical protein
MSFASRRLMKWREPKIKGMVTIKDVVIAFILALILSVPFGYVGGHGKFNVSVWLLGLLSLSIAPLGIAISPLLPGTLVQLTEERIVYGPRGTNSCRSAYREIVRICYVRYCTCSMEENQLVFKVHEGSTTRPLCTVCEVINRNQNVYSVRRFIVPDSVNLEHVLQIFHDKSVKVEETRFT